MNQNKKIRYEKKKTELQLTFGLQEQLLSGVEKNCVFGEEKKQTIIF